jgi:putative flippase GtrA
MMPPEIGYGVYVSQLAGIAVATVWNYLANFFWTWRAEKADS